MTGLGLTFIIIIGVGVGGWAHDGKELLVWEILAVSTLKPTIFTFIALFSVNLINLNIANNILFAVHLWMRAERLYDFKYSIWRSRRSRFVMSPRHRSKVNWMDDNTSWPGYSLNLVLLYCSCSSCILHYCYLYFFNSPTSNKMDP